MDFFNFIPQFLGQILFVIYDKLAMQNYGLAIIIFTIFIKLILLPLTLKQYKSTAKMQELQPLIEEVRRKYKNDMEKQNQEMWKIYQEHKYNPASGCLPLLVQMPILFSLIYVIGKPLNYMLRYDAQKIKDLIDSTPATEMVKGFYEQIYAVKYHNILDMNFLGLDLGRVPKFNPADLFGPQMSIYLPLILIPILAVTTTYLSTKMMMLRTSANANKNKNKNAANDMSAAMQKNMLYLAPAMTLFVSFQFPAGLGLYWLTGNVFQIIQQYFINKFMLKKKEA